MPPVVRTTRAPADTARLIASRTDSTPSGTRSTVSTTTSCSARSRCARGPERSSRSPLAQRSETVMTAPLTGAGRAARPFWTMGVSLMGPP